MSKEFISTVEIENVVRVRISDNIQKFIEDTQKKLRLDFPGMDGEISIQYPDFDAMKETVLQLKISKYDWKIGYYDYDGFWKLGPDIHGVAYTYFERAFKFRSKDKNKWKSEIIKFLTGEERIKMIQEGTKIRVR